MLQNCRSGNLEMELRVVRTFAVVSLLLAYGIAAEFAYLGEGITSPVHLCSIVQSDKFLFLERIRYQKNYVVSVYDYKTKRSQQVQVGSTVFCSGQAIMQDGNIVVVGGDEAIPDLLEDGRLDIRVFNVRSSRFTNVYKMRYNRWYPTVLTLPDGEVLLAGGTTMYDSKRGIQNNPMNELWNPQVPGATKQYRLPQPYLDKAGWIYYPIAVVTTSGDLLLMADTIATVINPYTGQLLGQSAELPNSKHSMYSLTSTYALLALFPENNYAMEFILFGGSFPDAKKNDFAVGSATSERIRVTAQNGNYEFSQWTVENMPSARVMADCLVLPNGHVVIVNGVQQGQAGEYSGGPGHANQPVLYAWVYNPYAKEGQRYTVIAKTKIPRLYHANIGFTADGTILVAGCDRCSRYQVDDNDVTRSKGDVEYRVELLTPPVILNTDRPLIISAPDVIHFNQQFVVQYNSMGYTRQASRVVLVAPSCNTHSTNFGHRVIGLAITAKNVYQGTVTCQGPPNVNIAAPGWYLIFVLSGDIYSPGKWLQLRAAGQN